MAPCNCGGKKTSPVSSSGAAESKTAQPKETERKWYSPGPQSSSGTFALKVDGKVTTYGSRLEYDAARRRAGL